MEKAKHASHKPSSRRSSSFGPPLEDAAGIACERAHVLVTSVPPIAVALGGLSSADWAMMATGRRQRAANIKSRHLPGEDASEEPTDRAANRDAKRQKVGM